MGFFSWETADTKESIPNIHANNDVANAGRPVYLLQPNGEPPIKECAYAGHGRFGGVDAYEWLARMNFNNDDICLAINAECGNYYYCPENDTYYICTIHLEPETLALVLNVDISKVKGFSHYDQVQPNGETPNTLIKNERGEKRKVALRYPLKFSFNPDAVYEDLPASKDCPYQGFFYE